LRKKNSTSFNKSSGSAAAQARWDRARLQADPERDSNDTPQGPHQAEAFASDNGSDLDLADLPRSTLVELLKDPTTAGYVRVRAAEAVSRLQPDDEASREWRTSAQVRPDYRPPTWDEVLDVARAAGAVVREDERGA
jgi:hypothetical protein